MTHTQQDFMCFVQRQAGAHDALYEAELDSGLPGDTVRVSMEATKVGDVSEYRYTLEFMSLTREGRWQSVGRIGHSLKELAAQEVESSFEVAGFGQGASGNAEVERVVVQQLEKLKAARLLPLRRTAPETGGICS